MRSYERAQAAFVRAALLSKVHKNRNLEVDEKRRGAPQKISGFHLIDRTAEGVVSWMSTEHYGSSMARRRSYGKFTGKSRQWD